MLSLLCFLGSTEPSLEPRFRQLCMYGTMSFQPSKLPLYPTHAFWVKEAFLKRFESSSSKECAMYMAGHSLSLLQWSRILSEIWIDPLLDWDSSRVQLSFCDSPLAQWKPRLRSRKPPSCLSHAPCPLRWRHYNYAAPPCGRSRAHWPRARVELRGPRNPDLRRGAAQLFIQLVWCIRCICTFDISNSASSVPFHTVPYPNKLKHRERQSNLLVNFSGFLTSCSSPWAAQRPGRKAVLQLLTIFKKKIKIM